jgi:hypothetical protein
MNVRYHRCSGSELFTDDGRRILDFLSSYCVYNTGHNHPWPGMTSFGHDPFASWPGGHNFLRGCLPFTRGERLWKIGYPRARNSDGSF